MRFRLISAVLIGIFIATSPVFAASPKPLKGVALVIGETDYVRLPSLVNPEKDARDIDHLLDDLGFEVERVLNDSTAALQTRIEAFLANAENADVALVYYAGHGIEAAGQNYLMGTDANIADPVEAQRTLLPLNGLLERLQAEVPVTIVLLDACRTNPFTGEEMLQLGPEALPVAISAQGLDVVRGPSVVEPKRKDSLGAVIGFSASPGQAALDGAAGENSPYAAAILEHLGAGGFSFGDIMTLVSQEVYVRTGARQLPWTSSSLSRVLYFGRSVEAAQGDDAAIISDRRKLLLEIAEAPDESRSLVEKVATQEGLDLAEVYAMLDTVREQKGAGDAEALIALAKRARDAIDAPILEAPLTDPELIRLDALAAKARAAGAFKLMYKYRVQEADRANQLKAQIDKLKASITKEQKQIDELGRQVTVALVDLADAAVLLQNGPAEAKALQRATAVTDLFDKSLSLKLRLRAAEAAFARGQQGDTKARAQATALYEDALKQIDSEATPDVWADVQLRLAQSAWEQSNTASDHSLTQKAIDAVEASLTILSRQKNFRKWSTAQRLLGSSLRNIGNRDKSLTVLTELVAATSKSTKPIDWAYAQVELGNTLYEIGYWYSNDDVALRQAADAYGGAAAIFRSTGLGEYEYSLALMGESKVRAGVRSQDKAFLAAGLADQRTALGHFKKKKGIQWANQTKMLGQGLIAGGLALKDAKQIEEGLTLQAAAEKTLTVKVQKADWAMMREYDGDALAYLGAQAPKNLKRLRAAIKAYAEASDAYDEMGHWTMERDRARLKKIKLQDALGEKVSAADKAWAFPPEAAPIDVSSAFISVRPFGGEGNFETFGFTIGGLVLDGKPMLMRQFELLVDYANAAMTPNDVDLARLVLRPTDFLDKETRAANFSSCGDMAGGPGKIRIHFGAEATLNGCLYDKMSDAEAGFWEALRQQLPGIVHKAATAAASTNTMLTKIDEILTVKLAEQVR